MLITIYFVTFPVIFIYYHVSRLLVVVVVTAVVVGVVVVVVFVLTLSLALSLSFAMSLLRPALPCNVLCLVVTDEIGGDDNHHDDVECKLTQTD